ncbi:hypothetical protein F5X98DRAFT_387463 [Xylaria grammica]|nr:hypothetical protein F5X98DRAFT_387463 [Xylaria grammica]
MGTPGGPSTVSEEDICGQFDAYIFRQEFLNDPYRNVVDLQGNYTIPVWDLLHNSLPERFLGTNDTPAEWIWVHLPAVNRKWILDLVRRMKGNGIIHNSIVLGDVEKFVKKSFTNASGVYAAPRQFDQRAIDIKARRLEETSQDDAKDTPSSSKEKAKEPATKGQDDSQQPIHQQLSETEMFALALPYLDSQSDLVEKEKLEQLRRHYGAFEGYPTEFLKDSEPRRAEVIFSRTLDQCFFSSTHVTANLDSDQVVYNYLNELSDKWRKLRASRAETNNPPPITSAEREIELRHHKTDRGRRLIASPLRLWKIGNVVISAFPDQENELLPSSELQRLICRSIWESCPISAMDLVLDLAHIFIDFVDRPFNSGLGLSPLWIFERVIAEEAEKQVVRYKEFEKIMRRKQEDKSERNGNTPEANLLVTPALVPNQAEQAPTAGQQGGNDHVLEADKETSPMSLIDEEAESFKNVMDIRDELGMIGSVIKEQEVAMTQLTKYLDSRGKPANRLAAAPVTNEPQGSGEIDPNLQNLKQKMEDMVNRVQTWQSRIEGLDKRTSMVEKGLEHLLDIKLKRSSLEEANDTKHLAADTNEVARLSKDIESRTHSVLTATNSVVTNTGDLAEKSEERARQSEKQSALIFAFTFVTIWFTPLSFVTGFLAIPSKDFPQDPTNMTVDWKRWQIGVGLTVAFLVTLLFSLSVWAGYRRETKDSRTEKRASKNDNKHDGGVNGEGPDEKAAAQPTGEAKPSPSGGGSSGEPTPTPQTPSPKKTRQEQWRSWGRSLRGKEAAGDSLGKGQSEKAGALGDGIV